MLVLKQGSEIVVYSFCIASVPTDLWHVQCVKTDPFCTKEGHTMTRGIIHHVAAATRTTRRADSTQFAPKLELVHTLERVNQDTSGDATLRELYLTKTQLRDAKLMLDKIQQRDDLSPELRDTVVRSVASLQRIQQRLDELAVHSQGLPESD
jgi:hypothetical protein